MEVRDFDMNTRRSNTILSITEKITNVIYSNVTIENKVVEIERLSYLTIAQKYKSKIQKDTSTIENRYKIENHIKLI